MNMLVLRHAGRSECVVKNLIHEIKCCTCLLWLPEGIFMPEISGFAVGLKEEEPFFYPCPLKRMGQPPPRLLSYPCMSNGELTSWQVFEHVMALTSLLHY